MQQPQPPSPHPPQAVYYAHRQGRFRNGDENGHGHENGISYTALPKHIPVPDIPRDSDVIFELVTFTFSALCCCLQFLNIYRTVFWLPNSFNSIAVNIQLIDFNLVAFIGTILVRRLIYVVAASVGQACVSSALWPVARKLIRLMMLCWVSVVLIVCLFNIMRSHPIVNFFYLCYPFFLYVVLYGLNIRPFFELMGFLSPGVDEKEKKKLSFDGCPLHNCSTSPDAIREEVDVLKCDINNRIKKVLFDSVFSAYYAGFIPVCFAQNMMHYDTYWASLHIAWLWLSCCVMYTVRFFPVRYCDVMHRSALHLGRWCRMILPQANVEWSENVLWLQDSIVKYSTTLYHAEAPSNAAEPGNSVHSRFYDLFHNPTRLYSGALTFQLTMITVQLFQLATAREWYQALCIVLILFFNYYTLFKVMRDFLVSHRVYKAERLVSERQTS